MQRGEVWWALIDERCPVVLLSGTQDAEWRAMRIVAPASPAEKRGFVVLSGDQAADVDTMGQLVAAAGTAHGGVGVEVAIGRAEGLPFDGVVRVALPCDGRIFCTWQVTLSREHLIDRAGALSPATLHQLGHALRLAEIE